MAGTNVDVELPDIKVLRQYAREKLAALLDSVRFNGFVVRICYVVVTLIRDVLRLPRPHL